MHPRDWYVCDIGIIYLFILVTSLLLLVVGCCYLRLFLKILQLIYINVDTIPYHIQLTPVRFQVVQAKTCLHCNTDLHKWNIFSSHWQEWNYSMSPLCNHMTTYWCLLCTAGEFVYPDIQAVRIIVSSHFVSLWDNLGGCFLSNYDSFLAIFWEVFQSRTLGLKLTKTLTRYCP